MCITLIINLKLEAMLNGGIFSILPLVIVIFAGWFIIGLFRKSKVSTLVLKSMTVQEKDNDDLLVYITGRPSGLMNWLLTTCGLSDLTVLRITKHEVEFKTSSLSGQDNSLMSLASLSSTHCGYYKPIYLIIAMAIMGVMTLIGIFAGGISALIFGIVGIGILWLIYYFNKKIRIMVQGRGGAFWGLSFSPSLIEGINVDIKKAEEIVTLVNKYVIKEQTGHLPA